MTVYSFGQRNVKSSSHTAAAAAGAGAATQQDIQTYEIMNEGSVCWCPNGIV